MSSIYESDNAEQRKRLAKLAGKLKDEDFARPIRGGWTIATKLAHLAYWDQYALARLTNWRPDIPQVGSLPVDEINAAVRAVTMALPPRRTIELAMAAAEAVDRQVESTSPQKQQTIESLAGARLLNRSLHRREHLDEIEETLESLGETGAGRG